MRSPSVRIIAPSGLPRSGIFVGRERSFEQVKLALTTGRHVLLSGPAGIGKTALAAEVVARLGPGFPGGAFWIPCDHLAGAEALPDVWTAVALALFLEGIAAEVDGERARAGLVNILQQRPPMLLVLDNLAASMDLDAILAALAIVGHTTLLLTMSHPVANEQLQTMTLEPLRTVSARSLFARSLLLLDEQARPSDYDAALARCGGSPLALRLLAGAIGHGSNGLAQRGAEHRAASAVDLAFALVWETLNASERALCSAIAVLLVGASLPRAGARALGDAATIAALERAALLLPIAPDRLLLHPSVRTLAARHWDQIAPPQQEALTDAALDFWIAFAAQYPGYTATEALETDMAGLLAALDWALDHDHAAQALALAQTIDYSL